MAIHRNHENMQITPPLWSLVTTEETELVSIP